MNELDQKNYIRMTETPVLKLILSLAVPTTVSMLITSIYNTADTFFVSKISVSASAATGIVFSLMAILQAFGFMFGHGAGSNISRLLGARNNERAYVFASTSFFLSLLAGAVIAVFGLIFIRPLMFLLGSTDTIVQDAVDYAVFILIGAPALVSSCVMNNILRYEGRASYAMVGLTTGGILNMALDPLFIFVFRMDIKGAGLATALSQYISFVILLMPFVRGKTSSRFALKYITKKFEDVRNIIITGLPNLIRQGLTAIAATVLNTLAAFHGDAAIAAFSITNRCANIIFAFAIGLAQGFQPVAAFNYGAKKYTRVIKATLYTMCGAILTVAVLGGLCFFNTEKVISLFREEQTILDVGSSALKFMCGGMVVLPVSAIGSMLFQSTGQKGRAAFIAMLQSGLLYIPIMYIFNYFFSLKGLEASQATAYLLASFITLPLVIRFLVKLKNQEASSSSQP